MEPDTPEPVFKYVGTGVGPVSALAVTKLAMLYTPENCSVFSLAGSSTHTTVCVCVCVCVCERERERERERDHIKALSRTSIFWEEFIG